jgi:5-(aminomethyl)-3-furanmethanol phosphate kinase
MIAPDALVKVGGSLSRGNALHGLCRALAKLGERYRLIVVPGGGDFANTVRQHYRRFEIGETAAHRMALLAMDQYGLLLSELISGSAAVKDVPAARSVYAAGRVAVLLPTDLLWQADPLPHAWAVTSDSLAAWIAGLTRARCLVLLKDVDGICASDPREAPLAPLLREMSVARLAGHRGGVDQYLAVTLNDTRTEAWVINGQHPGRLDELLGTGTTYGTFIPIP